MALKRRLGKAFKVPVNGWDAFVQLHEPLDVYDPVEFESFEERCRRVWAEDARKIGGYFDKAVSSLSLRHS